MKRRMFMRLTGLTALGISSQVNASLNSSSNAHAENRKTQSNSAIGRINKSNRPIITILGVDEGGREAISRMIAKEILELDFVQIENDEDLAICQWKSQHALQIDIGKSVFDLYQVNASPLGTKKGECEYVQMLTVGNDQIYVHVTEEMAFYEKGSVSESEDANPKLSEYLIQLLRGSKMLIMMMTDSSYQWNVSERNWDRENHVPMIIQAAHYVGIPIISFSMLVEGPENRYGERNAIAQMRAELGWNVHSQMTFSYPVYFSEFEIAQLIPGLGMAGKRTICNQDTMDLWSRCLKSVPEGYE